MDSRHASPFAFLAALNGERELDRAVISQTRPEELQICAHMTLAAKVATLYAFSGNGKSSLIQAGLIPFFNELGYAVFKTRPRPPYALTDPVEAFKEGCIRENWIPVTRASDADALGQARQELEARSIAELPAVRRLIERLDAQQIRLSATPENRSADLSAYLRRSREGTLSGFLGDAQRFLGNVPMIVICDQFEEIFVHYYNTLAIERFIESLKEACDNPALRVHFLFSMREDWVGSMIVFRDAIPDIFNCTYRLNPIRRSKAEPALSLPLARAGLQFDTDLAHHILDDLAKFYRRQQRMDDAAVQLTPSPSDDPFIELPALQTIADRLWQTRSAVDTPFSLAHYMSLASNAEIAASGSPAAAVLDGYLKDTLRNIDNEEEKSDQLLNDLRLDILYLMTDKLAHRRALGERQVLASLKMMRSNVADLEAVDRAMVRRALQPLEDCRLVRQDQGAPTADPRYELAHDFAVRSVVRAWKVLDRRRAQDAAVRAEQRRQDTSRLSALLQSDRLGAQFILVLTAIIMVLTFTVGAGSRTFLSAYQRYYYESPIRDYLAAASFGTPSALLALSLVRSVRTGVAISAVAFVLFYSAFFRSRYWPEASLALTHWATILLCMIPALAVDLSSALGIAEPRRRTWMRLGARAIDYTFILLSAVSTFVIFERENSWLLAFALTLGGLIVVQLGSVFRGGRSIGEWWVRYEPNEVTESQRARISGIVALLIVAMLNWTILVSGVQDYPTAYAWAPYGAPLFFLIHLSILIALLWKISRNRTSVASLPTTMAQSYEQPTNVAGDSADAI